MKRALLLQLIRNLLLNIGYNIVFDEETRRKCCSLTLVFVLYVFIRKRRHRRRRRTKRRQQQMQTTFSNKLLLTFSGSGQLGFYYQGVCAYLRDHFDTSNCVFAGISGGAAAAASMASDMPTEATMIFGLKWIKLLSDRRLKMFFLPASAFIDISIDICDEFGITDEYIREKSNFYKTKNSSSVGLGREYYYGVSNLCTFPPSHELLGNFESRYESFYLMSCSMRVFPFFTLPGYYKRKILIDGQFTAHFSIPANTDPSKVIRITPSIRLEADVQPNKYDSDSAFLFKDVFLIPTLSQIYEQFEKGYCDAMRCRDKLIRKGLPLLNKSNKPQHDGRTAQSLLDQHLSVYKVRGQEIFFGHHNTDTNTKGKQNFKHFLKQMDPK